MTKLLFYKMQGLGNDFMVVNALVQPFTLSAKQIVHLADRHRGVGFDQLLVLENPRHPAEDFFYRIFNADGSEVGQCGNGARCMGLFIYQQKLSTAQTLRLGTITRCLTVKIIAENQIAVDMGEAEFSPEKIPYLPEKIPPQGFATTKGPLFFYFLSMGNPHAVTIVPDVDTVDVANVGREVSLHPAFPQQTNVIFMQVLDSTHVRCRIYERSAAETLACGSGACAAVVAGIQQKKLAQTVTVHLRGGDLIVRYEANHVWMQGEAKMIFEGVIHDLEKCI